MDAGEALEGLLRLSAEIRTAAILDGSGALVAATPAGSGDRLARAADDLLAAAAVVHPDRTVDRIAVGRAAGGIVVVRGEDGRSAVATTGPEPPVALVVHDLRACLGALAGKRSPAEPAEEHA